MLAVHRSIIAHLPPQPRLLDLGAGSGRIGWPFVAAHDDYVGLDVSFPMLQAFRARSGGTARLVRADGVAMPYADATFDGVLLVQVFGGLENWRAVMDEARRVLRRGGALILGRVLGDADGIDTQMKRALADILGERPRTGQNSREQAERDLAATSTEALRIEAAQWTATRTPRGFLARHATGARFSRLALEQRTQALRALSDWATTRFGSLDAEFTEAQRFELRFYRFAEG